MMMAVNLCHAYLGLRALWCWSKGAGSNIWTGLKCVFQLSVRMAVAAASSVLRNKCIGRACLESHGAQSCENENC